MRLTKFSDFAIRVLILAASRPGRNVTIEEAAAIHGISAAHLKKVVRELAAAEFLTGTRGRGGGFRLARKPEEIGLGEVIRTTEPDFALVECYRPDSACRIMALCRLQRILDESLEAMLAVLDRYTLADALAPGAAAMLLRIAPGDAASPDGPQVERT